VRVATFNLHAGVDGWGRPTRVLDLVKELDADVLILPELWRADDGPDFYEELRTSLCLDGAFAALAKGERVTSGVGTTTWQPRLAHFVGERGLYFNEHRTLTKAQLTYRSQLGHVEAGTWGLGLLTRLAVEDVRVVSLGRLPREKVQRALVVARLREGERSFHVLAIHGAHLSHGSYRQYRRVKEFVATLDPALPYSLAVTSTRGDRYYASSCRAGKRSPRVARGPRRVHTRRSITSWVADRGSHTSPSPATAAAIISPSSRTSIWFRSTPFSNFRVIATTTRSTAVRARTSTKREVEKIQLP